MRTGALLFGVLGPLRIEARGAPLPPPRSLVLRGLLGVLLVAREQPLSASRLIDLVWADRAERVGIGALHVGISRLRQWLRRLDAPAESGCALEHNGGGYRLILPAEAVDLGRFHALVERARSAAGPDERCLLLESALALRRGPVLADLPAVGLSDPLLRIVEEQICSAAVDLTAAALGARRPGTVLSRLATLAEAYPLDEELHACLIELLVADGRPADAIRRYQAFREAIIDELGVEPGERVHQVYLSALARDHERSPGTSQPARSVPVPAQLPPDVHDFVGRENHLSELSEALNVRSVPMVCVITGMGGVGKTALALHFAHRQADRFPDGQLYAKLRGPDASPVDTRQILSGFLRALGVSGRDVPHDTADQASLYRSLLAGRRILVVLDDAPSEQHVRPLLSGTPGSATVVTSRMALTGLESARLVPLDVLETQQAVELLDHIAGHGRVAAEPEATSEVARLCAYLPLAVRIAGARLYGRRHWTMARLAATLGDESGRLDELTAGDLAIRASFALNYTQMPAMTRRTFRLLGLLEVPDFGEWPAAALLDTSFEAGRTQLDALVDAQLLTVAATDATGRPRYRFHDLVRLYARERAYEEESAETRAAAVKRAVGAWLWLAERGADDIPGPCYAAIHGPARRWPLPTSVADELLSDPMSWFDAERTALIAAVDQCCALGLDDFAWDVAASLEKYFDVRGMPSDWRRLHEKALGVCTAVGNRRGEAVLLRGLAEVTTWLSSEESGEAMVTLYEQARRLLDLFADIGERRGMSDALVMQCWGLVAQGDTARALNSAREALRLARETRHLGGEARAHLMMGITYGEQWADSAVDHLMRSLDLARALGNPRFEATAMQFLGAAQCATGRVEIGHDLLVRSLRICHGLRDRYAEAFSLLYLGKLYTALGDQRARPAIEAVISVSSRHNMLHHLADALKVLGELDMASGQFASAALRLEESVRIWRTRGWRFFLADALRALGRAYRMSGDEESARKSWREALGLFEQLADEEAASQISALLSQEMP